MRRFTWSALVLVAACGKGDIRIDDRGGRTFAIVAPEPFVERGRFPFNRMAGCGFDVDWGDGQPPAERTTSEIAPPCSTFLSHTYASPGSYTVTARLYHVAPTDAHVTDATFSARVVVK